MEIRELFSQDAIEMPERFVTEYSFYLKGINDQITIRLYESVLGNGYMFTQSHFIKTPIQAGPYMTDHATGSTEEEAIQRALRTFISYYDGAIKEGYEPEDT
jgi:hypothetical protein